MVKRPAYWGSRRSYYVEKRRRKKVLVTRLRVRVCKRVHGGVFDDGDAELFPVKG